MAEHVPHLGRPSTAESNLISVSLRLDEGPAYKNVPHMALRSKLTFTNKLMPLKCGNRACVFPFTDRATQPSRTGGGVACEANCACARSACTVSAVIGGMVIHRDEECENRYNNYRRRVTITITGNGKLCVQKNTHILQIRQSSCIVTPAVSPGSTSRQSRDVSS